MLKLIWEKYPELREIINRHGEIFPAQKTTDSAGLVIDNHNGGIDLNPNAMGMSVDQGDRAVIVPVFDKALEEQYRNAPGFVPNILRMETIQNLPWLIGLTDDPTPLPVTDSEEPTETHYLEAAWSRELIEEDSALVV